MSTEREERQDRNKAEEERQREREVVRQEKRVKRARRDRSVQIIVYISEWSQCVLKSVNTFPNALLVSNWKIALIFWFPFQRTLRGQGPTKTGRIPIWIIIRRLVFILFYFFVNRFVLFFLYSVLPSSLLNARLRFHVIHPHLIIQHKVSFSSRFISFFLF